MNLNGRVLAAIVAATPDCAQGLRAHCKRLGVINGAVEMDDPVDEWVPARFESSVSMALFDTRLQAQGEKSGCLLEVLWELNSLVPTRAGSANG